MNHATVTSANDVVGQAHSMRSRCLTDFRSPLVVCSEQGLLDVAVTLAVLAVVEAAVDERVPKAGNNAPQGKDSR